jgi:hypothetical protein
VTVGTPAENRVFLRVLNRAVKNNGTGTGNAYENS